jgi:hypothetical protein
MLRVLIEYWYIKDAVISLLIILIFFWIVFKQLTYHLNAHFSWNLLFWKRSYLDNSIFQQGIIKICFLLQFIPRKKPKAELGDADGFTEEKVEELLEELWRILSRMI